MSFFLSTKFIYLFNKHACGHAYTGRHISVKKYGQKRPDRDVPRIYVSGRNDPEPNCSFTNFM